MPPACRFATPAPEETIVYGACEPGWDRAAPTVDGWITFMQERGIERVCCLLSDEQVSEHNALLDQYQATFGDDRVKHVPVTDHTLADIETVIDDILPFLVAADTADELVVVHCRAGIGRTGQVLAAWLVYEHGYDPEAAIEMVEKRHRRPTDAVQAGNANQKELLNLLNAVADHRS